MKRSLFLMHLWSFHHPYSAVKDRGDWINLEHMLKFGCFLHLSLISLFSWIPCIWSNCLWRGTSTGWNYLWVSAWDMLCGSCLPKNLSLMFQLSFSVIKKRKRTSIRRTNFDRVCFDTICLFVLVFMHWRAFHILWCCVKI